MAFDHSFVSGGGNFPQTRWSVIAAAGSDDSAERSRALDVLFTAYWKPVYKYIRLKFSKIADDVLQRVYAEKMKERKSRSRTGQAAPGAIRTAALLRRSSPNVLQKRRRPNRSIR